MAEEIEFDFNDLTLEEIEMFEEHTGLALQDVSKETGFSAKTLTAFAFIAMRRQDPDFSMEQAKKLKIKEATDALDALKARPTTPAG